MFVQCLLLTILVCAGLKEAKADADSQRQKVIDFHKSCLDTHDVLEQSLHDALDGIPQSEQSFYMHLICTGKKAGILTDEGNVDLSNIEEKLKTVIEPENMAIVVSLVKKCLIQTDDVYMTIKSAADCFFKEQHNM